MTDSEKLDLLLKKVTNIELHLENVTDKNIQTIAEGHLDLSRKLDEALKVENEKELLIIRVRILENELRKIKERLDEIA
jgi:N-glycosylase/DNA lyase